jgi:F-type H+-transporting ATPase subunit b
MQIDWFTIVAQLINFLILVWLLKRFLYQPILNAIDAREKRIATTLQHAEETRLQASSEQEKFKSLNAEITLQRSTLLEEARASANQVGEKILNEARIAADALVEKRRQEQLRDIQKLRAEIHHLTTQEVFSLTREILSGLAGTSLEERMLAVFTKKLQDMASSNRTQLIEALTSQPSGGTISSSLLLNNEQQKTLQSNINNWVGYPVPLEFIVNESLICGVRLSAKGQQTDWSIDVSLNQLEAALNATLAKASDLVKTKSTHDHPT